MSLLSQEITLDAFAGGGGASTGIEMAFKAIGLDGHVDIAVNHDEDALAMHSANHPGTLHVREDIFKTNIRELVGKRNVRLLWMSPDCKHFSKAKGGKPVEKKIRGLAWVGTKWAQQLKPRVICLENVEEFKDWGPLVEIEGAWYPDPKRKGLTFQRFVGRLRGLGYKVEWKELRACDYGAPTIRRRLFLVARCDGQPIVWPKPSHGNGTSKPYRTAAECIDFNLPCPSIFERNKPLADATMRRIARGVMRYVIEAQQPFIVNLTHAGSDRVEGLDQPFRTITGAKRGEKALIVPTLIQAAHGEGKPGGAQRWGNGTCDIQKPVGTLTGSHSHALVETKLAPFITEHANASSQRSMAADEPLRTQCAQVKGGHFGVAAATLVHIGNGERKGQAPRAQDIKKPANTVVASQKHALVTAFLAQHNTMPNGGIHAGHDARKPVSTISAKGSQQQVVTSHLVRLKGACKDGQPVTEPLRTVQAGGTHFGEVRAFLIRYYSEGGQWATPAKPMSTILTKDRIGLVMVHGEPYAIADIGMRMLTPRELARAQGFHDNYVIDRGQDGRPLTKTAQVRMIGNSVCPPIAAALVKAQFAAEMRVRKAA